MAETASCPWCGFESRETYAIQLHIEELHTEDSPFVVSRRRSLSSPGRGGKSRADEERWVKCTRQGCGQYVAEENLEPHLDYHDAIATRGGRAYEERSHQTSPGSPRVLNGTGYARPQVASSKAPSQGSSTKSGITVRSGAWQRPSSRARYSAAGSSKSSGSSKAPSSQASSNKASSQAQSQVSSARSSATSKSNKSTSSYSGSSVGPKDALKEHQKSGRLGTTELGPYAFEKAMPKDVRRCLENASKPSYECRIGPSGKLIREGIIYNETPRPVPILADLSALDPKTTTAFLCHKSVKHVHKIKCDGNFCGYWNIQMLLSWRLAVIEDPAHGSLPLPNVLEMQDTIEQAWDAGICSFGRTETGGIRNTRKWIGTHEAAAYFMQLSQPVTALSFRTSSNPKAPPAHEQLLDYVEAYFMSADLAHTTEKGSSRVTQLSPIYFQRPGHSMTIVGIERRSDGERVLLVFDPSFAVAEMLKQLASGRVPKSKIETIMAAFRQDVSKLSRWKEYEIMIPQAPF